MSGFFIVALMLAVGHLWHRVRALTERVDELAFAAPSSACAESSIDVATIEAPSLDEQGNPPSLPITPIELPLETAPLNPWSEPVVERDIETVAPPTARYGFEDLFGRRLPIWAGGVTLAIAGVLIVRYSIEAGLLSPLVRVIGALLFGAGLIAGAEAARRGKVGAVDPRVQQALAGAGAATLYGAVLAATDLYGLIGTGTGFAGLAAVTVLAGLLSLRFGAPSAVLGLIGGLAAPAMVASPSPSIPLLAAYLALTIAGLCLLARGRGWWWLGAAAIAGGFAWNLAMIVGGAPDTMATLSIGGLALLLAAGLPGALEGQHRPALRAFSLLSGAAQVAALVALSGFPMLDWGLYALLGAASVWLGGREPGLAALPSAALAIALALMAAWPSPEPTHLAVVIGGAWAVFGIAASIRLWRVDGKVEDAAHVATLALATGLLPLWHFAAGDPRVTALPALLGALLTALLGAYGVRRERRDDDVRFAVLATSGGFLTCVAAAVALPGWLVAPGIAMAALALLGIGRRSGNVRVVIASAVAGGVAILLALTGWEVLIRSVGLGADADWQAFIRVGIPAGVAAIFAATAPRAIGRIAQVVGVLLSYAALAQVLPLPALPVLAAVTLALGGIPPVRASSRSLAPAVGTAAIVVLAWTVGPLAVWAFAGLDAIGGHPLMSSALPFWSDTIRMLALPALAFTTAARFAPIEREYRAISLVVAAALAAITLHIAYRYLFVIDGAAAFVAHGVAERTVWEMLLAAGAIVAWRGRARPLAIALGAASLLHFGWFGVVLHNPLWAEQNPGPWLIPAFATALGLLAASATPWPAGGRARTWSAMALVVLFAITMLRQLSADAMPLATGTGAGEDIARSVLAVILSIAFLRIGIARAARDWRIGSLALMIAAVAKVFLHDAAGLDGLARIASFAALGFSLIGIGWLYSRYLPDRRDVL